MANSGMTGPFGDDERKEPWDGEDDETPFAEEEALENADVENADLENADGGFEDEELPLADEEARLPWLESDDDDEDVGGYSTGQTIGLVLAALLVLGLIVGGIWWLTRAGPDADLVADGSTIESEGPYKQRPDDPGGKVFDGTGDSSFKVSEGQSAPARLGQADAQPVPGFETLGKGENGQAAKPANGTGSGAVDTAGVGVQIGAYSDRAAAEAGWSRHSQQHGALKGMRHRVLEGKADIGTVYRLQVVADDASAANVLCNGLKSSGLNCYVKK